MYKLIVLCIVVLLILILGNIYITREGFQQSPTTSSGGCSFDEEQEDENCNNIQIRSGDTLNSFVVNTVCPDDPRCIGICVNDHTWTDANKRNQLFSEYVSGTLKDEQSSHLISTSRCGECIKNFYPIIRLIHERNQCNI